MRRDAGNASPRTQGTLLKDMKQHPLLRTFAWLGVFGVAMGFLEAIVVVYLRQIHYPGGFSFPLSSSTPGMISVEWLRESATIVMLLSIAAIAGKNYLQKFAWFLYSFAVWDIFYYVALKLLLNWPPSLLTWDVLFLIPVIWVGPVLAPVICSLTMILLAGCIVFLQDRNCEVKIGLSGWALILSGAFIILGTFIWDYSAIIIRGGFLSDSRTLATNEQFSAVISQYTPVHYRWGMFAVGEVLILFAIARTVLVSQVSRSESRR